MSDHAKKYMELLLAALPEKELSECLLAFKPDHAHHNEKDELIAALEKVAERAEDAARWSYDQLACLKHDAKSEVCRELIEALEKLQAKDIPDLPILEAGMQIVEKEV